jgi:hypothetical protein
MLVTVNIHASKPHTRTLLLNSKRIERHIKCRTCPSIIFTRSLTNVAHLANITVFWCAGASAIILCSIRKVPSVHLPMYCGCYLLTNLEDDCFITWVSVCKHKFRIPFSYLLTASALRDYSQVLEEAHATFSCCGIRFVYYRSCIM